MASALCGWASTCLAVWPVGLSMFVAIFFWALALMNENYLDQKKPVRGEKKLDPKKRREKIDK